MIFPEKDLYRLYFKPCIDYEFHRCDRKKVVGYYALATGSVERTASTADFARGMPNPISVIILARLGTALLKDAMLGTLYIYIYIGQRRYQGLTCSCHIRSSQAVLSKLWLSNFTD